MKSVGNKVKQALRSIRPGAGSHRGGKLAWIAFPVLLLCSLNAHAVSSERFLDRLSSETKDDRLFVTIHFMQTLQYLSHTPDKRGNRISIQFRKTGPVLANIVNQSLGEGTKTLIPGDRALPLKSVTATGDLNMDPGVIVEFHQAQDFEIRSGPDARSIRIVLEQPAAPARAEATGGALLAEVPEFTGTSPEDKKLQELFHEARKSLEEENYQRATAIYDKIIAAGTEPYTAEAILALGVARAANGQYAQAQAQYELFLERYPDSPKAVEVKNRIVALQEELQASQPINGVAVVPGTENWQYFGTIDQFYLYDGGKYDNRSSEDYRSSLLSSANVSWLGRTKTLDISGRFSGSYDYSFLDERDSPGRVSYLYLDVADHEDKHQGRLGRQRLSGSGVLGYFDGLQYQYKLNDEYALRYVGGSPVYSSKDGVDTDRLFDGLAVDYQTLDDSLFISLYGLNQTYEGDTDRRALGAEIRYFSDAVSLYSLLDYDIYFDELNIFHLFGNWRISKDRVASITLEQRRSPLLALSNALQGPVLGSVGELRSTFTDDELEELALARSLVYKSVYASMTQQLTDRWQALFDAGFYNLSTDTSVPGSLEEDIDSDDWYLYAQLQGNGLFKPRDFYSAGLRYADSDRQSVTSLLFRARIPVQDRLQVTPRLRFDYRDRDQGGNQWQISPSLFTTYRITKKTSLELNIGLEYRQMDDELEDDVDEQYYYLSLGYRHDF